MSWRNEFFDHGFSDESDQESGYDSEAVEVSRSERRGVKKRKLSHSSHSSDEEITADVRRDTTDDTVLVDDGNTDSQVHLGDEENDIQDEEIDFYAKNASTTALNSSKKPKKEKTPGVIYLSSLPPYLKPSALRNLLAQRGFEPITRLFLTPSSKHKHNSKKSSRQLYTEGWIEFANKKTAKRCADALNAQLVGGRKGGFYHDDLWNMKYLKGMAWDELMAGIREERREEEGRRDEERRKIAAETRAYIEGVEKGKQIDGMKRKRTAKGSDKPERNNIQRTWRQHEVATNRKRMTGAAKSLDSDVQQVLSKII